MRVKLIWLVPVFLAGAVFGAAFWYLASPLWIDRVVSESFAAKEQTAVLAGGHFSGSDAVHQGEGNAWLVKLADGRVELQLRDFKVTNGPDLEVWLSSNAAPESKGDVMGGEWVSLGALKGNIGDQAYPVAADIDLEKFKSAVIWCEQFGVLFAAAPLAAN